MNVEVKCGGSRTPIRRTGGAGVDLVRRTDVVLVLDPATGTVAYAPELSTGFLVHGSDIETAAAVSRAHGHPWLHPDRAAVLAAPDAAVAHARRNDLRVDVWTVDDPDEMQVLATAGVDAIITNVPDVALDVLG